MITCVALPGALAQSHGIQIADGLSPEDFTSLLRTLATVQGSVLWWYGDALVYAARQAESARQLREQNPGAYATARETDAVIAESARYGELYDAAMATSGHAYATLGNAKFLCSRIDFSRRRENLTYSHHMEVAYAFEKHEDQDAWLDRAEREALTVSGLRMAIRKSLADPEQRETAAPLPPWGGSAFDTFKDGLLRENITKWTPEQRKQWKADLEPIVRVWERL